MKSRGGCILETGDTASKQMHDMKMKHSWFNMTILMPHWVKINNDFTAPTTKSTKPLWLAKKHLMDSHHTRLEFGVEHLGPFSCTSTGTQHTVLAHQVRSLSQILSKKPPEETQCIWGVLGWFMLIHIDSQKRLFCYLKKCTWYWKPENGSLCGSWGHPFRWNFEGFYQGRMFEMNRG